MKRGRAPLVVVAILLIAGCGGDDPADDPAADEASTTTTADGATTPTADQPGGGTLDDVAISLTEVAELDSPTTLGPRPGTTDLYATERAGTVRVLRADGDGLAVDDEPLIDLSDDVSTDGERGLLGLAFSADGDTLYLSYTNADGNSRLVAYAMDGDAVDEGSRRELLAVEQPFSNHNGGDVHLGPDGLLWYGLGDGGSSGDPEGNGQDPTTLLGAVLRIDPEAPTGDLPYGIPADNPFADGAAADGTTGRPEVFLYGVRNPYRFSFDAETDDLWIADVGQNAIEEIDFLAAGTGAGANLGWAEMEGSEPYEGGSPPAGHVPPIFEYSHDERGCSVTGGFVYRGDAIGALQGAYVYGDYCAPELRALTQADGDVTAERGLGVELSNLVGFGTDTAGELYALSLDGVVARLDPA
ncbi:PQQ-dependent sugar dehydrogenase [soil metagenome]